MKKISHEHRHMHILLSVEKIPTAVEILYQACLLVMSSVLACDAAEP